MTIPSLKRLRMKRWLAGILFVGLLITGVLALSGQFVAGDRELIRIENPVATTLPGTGQFLAGVAEVDITPPPGFLPRAGYATWSTIGEGFRTRLFARVYYLKDGEGDSHAVIQTDLTSGSRILHARLGEYLAAHTDLDASRLTLTATHSHSAPGQIVGSEFYNKHISNQAGFARDYFEFLVERIGRAAVEAYEQRRPARLATGVRDVWGLTRNRSIQAYVENRTVSDKREIDSQTFHAVNPSLYMVRIDEQLPEGGLRPMGAFASFSIHGTAIPQSDTLFNADVWAYIHGDWRQAVLENERHQQSAAVESQSPVFSAFEGTHGDVAPASRFGELGYLEARRIGQAIARETVALYESLSDQWLEQVDIRSAIRHVNLRQAPSIDGTSICDEAAAGMTLAAAPLEHTSPVIGYLPFFKQGSRRWGDEADNCQGRKRILGFDSLQGILEPKDSFPDSVNFQLVQIGNLLLVPLPFELTTETGYRIEQGLRRALASGNVQPEHVLISSLAGGYTGYITTPEEYDRQYYEGGHTIYGKYSQPYVQKHLEQLARDMYASSEALVSLPEQWQFNLVSRDFLPAAEASTGQRMELASPEYSHARGKQEGYWRFQWRDVNVGHIEMHSPLLSIEVEQPNGQWQALQQEGRGVSDLGYDMGVRLLNPAAEQGMADYEAYWFNPLFEGQKRRFRFAVEARGGLARFYSSPFN